MPVEIEEILRRSEQGKTEPYICRGSDNLLYFVKGRGATYASLVKEWVAGQLGVKLGLPIPHFEIVSVPQVLYQLDRSDALSGLGFGEMFGSQSVENVNEISMVNVTKVDPSLKCDIAAFDWWVMNGDRTLSDAGGNPNLLWSDKAEELFVIDHNLAFDETVTLNSQIESHIFSTQLSEICASKVLQHHYARRFAEALSVLPEIIRDIPERWYYADEHHTIDNGLPIDRVEMTLQRYEEPTFWKRT